MCTSAKWYKRRKHEQAEEDIGWCIHIRWHEIQIRWHKIHIRWHKIHIRWPKALYYLQELCAIGGWREVIFSWFWGIKIAKLLFYWYTDCRAIYHVLFICCSVASLLMLIPQRKRKWTGSEKKWWKKIAKISVKKLRNSSTYIIIFAKLGFESHP